MRHKVTAVFVAAAFMVVAGVVGAAAEQRRNSFDDWLGFDQSDDGWDQLARERASAGIWKRNPIAVSRRSRKKTSRQPKRP